MTSYTIGGRLGDFVHGLVVPAFLYEQGGEVAEIGMADIGDKFLKGAKATYDELVPIMNKQAYVSSFVCGEPGPEASEFELFKFRKSPLVEKACWTEIYFKTFLPNWPIPEGFSWMTYDEDAGMHGTLVVSRRFILNESTQYYLSVMKQFSSDKVFFICDNHDQWLNSGLTKHSRPLVCKSIADMFLAINSCSVFLGDQSAPFAIASALGKDRIIELNRMRSFYEGEGKYYKNFSWFCNGYVPLEATL